MLVTLTAGILMLAVYRRGAPAMWAWAAGAAMIVLDLPIVGTIRPQLFGQLGAALFLLACCRTAKAQASADLAADRRHAVGEPARLDPDGAGDPRRLCRRRDVEPACQEHGQKAALVLRDKRFVIVWAALVLALAGACVNPHGPALLARIVFFGEHAALSSIMEWRSLTPGSLTGMLMIASAGLTVLIFKTSPRKWELHEVLMLLAFGLATLPAIRMLAWWAVVWPWVILPHAAAAWKKYQQSKTGESPEAER